jgi:hypothetical protein
MLVLLIEFLKVCILQHPQREKICVSLPGSIKPQGSSFFASFAASVTLIAVCCVVNQTFYNKYACPQDVQSDDREILESGSAVGLSYFVGLLLWLLMSDQKCKKSKKSKKSKSAKRTTPGIPTWSPTVVLTGPDDA